MSGPVPSLIPSLRAASLAGRATALALALGACVGADDALDQQVAQVVATREPAAEPPCVAAGIGFDIDVPRVWIHGAFRLNDAVPPAAPDQSAIIELRSERHGVVELGALHEGGYGRWIIPGRYDVVYRAGTGAGVPANAETYLARDVDLTAGAAFDVAVDSVAVAGDITIDGAPPPGGFYEQGTIRLRDRTTGAEFTIGRSLDGSYAATVIPGIYDVVWSRTAGTSLVPANADAIVAEGVAIDGTTPLDVDVPTVVRTGAFQLAGQSPPAGIYENAEILLRDNRTGDLITLGQTRDQTYSRRIVPGTYDVIYSRLLGTTMVPRNELAVVAHDVELSGDGDLAIDIPVVTVSGSFSLDGAPFPQGIYNRGRVWLQGAEPADTFELGTTDADYQIKLIPGTYDVVYQKLTSTGLVPENPWSVVSTGHTITKPRGSTRPTVLDIPISSGWLAADVTVWGATPSTSMYQNAQIRGENAAGDPVVLGTTRDAGGSARVLAGSYDLRYAHLIGEQVAANGDAIVATTATQPAVTPVALDLHPGILMGDFTQGGAPFPLLADDSADLSLRDRQTGDLVVLGNTFAQDYQRNLLGGTYDVIYDHVSGGVVANRGARLGCVAFTPIPPIGVQPGGFVTP